MKAFVTSLQQQKHNQIASLLHLQCNTSKLSTSLPVCKAELKSKNDLVFGSLHAISVPYKHEKSVNLSKHVQWICNYNSKMHKKAQQYLLIFLQLLKSVQPIASRERQ